MAPEKRTTEQAVKTVSLTLFAIAALATAVFAIWWGIIGSDCPKFWLSDSCAARLIRKTCPGQEFQGIVAIESYAYSPADPAVARNVTYEFKRIPEAGKVSGAETLRTTTRFIYAKTYDQNGKPILDKNHDEVYEWEVVDCQ